MKPLSATSDRKDHMNNDTFKAAQEAYKEGDFPRALQTFTQCLQDTEQPCAPGEIGLLYHRIGNCLVKLGDYNEAIRAFAQASADSEYSEVGAVNCNMGTAYAVLQDYENAVKYFEIAVSDSRYATPYKAYMGMGNALLRLGKSAEAGAAFRSAALDNNNPSPVNALLNLGVCFMALNRPADAVTSYESALQFDMSPATRNKLYANIGQAYVANNQFQQAVNAFETALADKTYFLNDAASVDYQQAIAMVSTGTAIIRDLKVEPTSDISGIDVPASESGFEDLYPEDSYNSFAEGATAIQEPIPDNDQDYAMAQEAEDKFFNASDQELEEWSKSVGKAKKRGSGCLKFFIVVVIVAILAAGAGIFAYASGYGYPTQEATAQALFASPQSADNYASTVSDEDITNFSKFVVSSDSPTIDGVERDMTSSSVYVTTQTDQGGDISYKVSMVRDGLGWKVSDIELYFASEN